MTYFNKDQEEGLNLTTFVFYDKVIFMTKI